MPLPTRARRLTAVVAHIPPLLSSRRRPWALVHARTRTCPPTHARAHVPIHPPPTPSHTQKLREELHEIALAKCDNIIRDFVDCSKASGILVVFKCREQNKNMNDCLTSYKNAEAFERYRSMREAELVGDI